jgi:glycosyltransferase involved in cell wall biosynthesis
MRILYSFPFAIGSPGIGTTALNQVLGLLDRGHQVTVMATSVHQLAPRLPDVRLTLTIAGVRVPHRVFGMDRTTAYHDTLVAAHLRQHADAYDVVHCWPGATLKTARAAAAIGVPALREVPNTHTENAYAVVGRVCAELGIELPPGSSHRSNPARLAREQKEYEAAFRLLVPSEHVADSFRTRGFAEDKLLRHRYGFDPKAFTPGPEVRPGPLRAVFLGSVGPRKGLHVALQAWARSSASKKGRFAIYGQVEDTYRPIIEPLLAAPGVELREFSSNVNEILQDSDVLLLPSFEEGSALVTYEAQGCGVIPLVSDAAGAVCAPGVTGLIHPTGDVDTLTRHLDQLSQDVELRRSMRRAVLAQREGLSWAAAAERLEACYESARAALGAATQPAPVPGAVEAPATRDAKPSMTLLGGASAAARRLLRRQLGIWPMMEFRNKLVAAPKLPGLARLEKREVARLTPSHGALPKGRVACIIPTFRRPEGVVNAIRSILDQEFQDFVIVVVDDGAGLPELPADPRIFAVSLSRNTAVLGLVRNVGIRLSQSEFIAFLDDDNTWTPQHLSVSVAALEKDADLVYTAVRRYLSSGEELDVLSKPFDRGSFADERSWVDANAIVLRRSVCKPFSRVPRTKATSPKEDWEFVWRVSQSARVKHIPLATVKYLVNPESFYTVWRSRAGLGGFALGQTPGSLKDDGT